MPAQKYVDKYTLKTLSMEPIGIPPNNSQQHLMHDCDTIDVVPSLNPIKDRQSVNQGVTAWQWITVAILCYVNLINYMDRYTVAGILKDISDYYQIGDDKAGLLQTVFVLSYMLFAPLFGYLGDRYSRKFIMAFGVFLWSLTTLLGSFMTEYYWFLAFRTLVGIGEASYSVIAPTIISDLFVDDMRSKMLSLFYFAIPVGSGLGYIVGSETARLANAWQWGLRVTPILGGIAVILIILLLIDPPRGEAEGRHTSLETTAWKDDIKALVKNKSFMLSTGGFTCVAFVTGALAWWGPRFIDYGQQIQSGTSSKDVDSGVSFKFGVIAMISGLIGVPLGSFIATRFRQSCAKIDPLICAVGLFLSTPFIFLALIFAKANIVAVFVLIFFGEIALNLNWAIVADMLLYVVTPNRRSTAEAFQILFSHALGDAGSPYLVGVISEALKKKYSPDTPNVPIDVEYRSLQEGLFSTCFVEVLGGVLFLLTSFYIVKDKAAAEGEFAGNENAAAPTHMFADDPRLSNSEVNLTTA